MAALYCTNDESTQQLIIMENDTYDVVVCGTGFTESILSGLLSLEGKKVLHIDRNEYYGDEGASLNLTNLWKKFRNGTQPPQELGANREWNVDLIPKFIMSSGKLVKMLLKTQVSYYLRWKGIEATYVYQYKRGGLFSSAGGKIEKVPATASEAVSSDLMSLFEKRRCKNFFEFVQEVDLLNPSTWKKYDLKNMLFKDLLDKFSLEENTADFIGHAVALYVNDDFLNKPCLQTIERMQLYMDSVGRFGPTPFIYPVYGLGGIPEGFSRKAAVGGGTFMLNQDIEKMEFGADGKVNAVVDGEKKANTTIVIASPYYLVKTGQQAKLKEIGKVIRAICLLDHPIPDTKKANSMQIIIPQRQTGRKSDIYIMVVSGEHAVCKNGTYLAIISTTVETNNPEAELRVAYELIGAVKEKFVTVSPMYEPASPNVSDNLYITKTLDPTSTFESAALDVLRVYKMITGKDLDLTNLPEDIED
jgi:Rab GDP dissociation inhibitor